jgi:hypothetical protein
MPDTKKQLQRIDLLEMPDEWGSIRYRAPRADLELDDAAARVRSRPRRPLLAATVLLVTIAVIGAALLGLSGLRGGSVGIPATGEIVRYRLAGPPQPITVGAGAAWVHIGAGTGTTTGFVRIDAATGAQRTLDVPGGGWSAVGGGSVWLICNAAACGGGSVLRMDPETGDVIDSVALPGRGVQIAGTDAGAWVTTEAGVSFVDVSGVVRSFPGRSFKLVGSDGTSVWVSTEGGVRALDPVDGHVVASVSFPDVCNMEAGDGMVWIASCDGGSHAGNDGDELMGINAATGDVKFRTTIEGYGQMRYAEGVLYLAQGDPTDDSRIRILSLDPQSGEDLRQPIGIPRGPMVEMDQIFPPPVFFAIGEGSLWVADFHADEVIRVGLPEPTQVFFPKWTRATNMYLLALAAGTLVERQGCIFLAPDEPYQGHLMLLIWPNHASLARADDGNLEILFDGHPYGEIGDHIELGGGNLAESRNDVANVEQVIGTAIPDRCRAESYWSAAPPGL